MAKEKWGRKMGTVPISCWLIDVKEVAMSQKGIEQLIGRALADSDFMEAVMKDPEGEIKKTGFDISPEELTRIKQIDRTKTNKFAELFMAEFRSRKQAIPL